MNTDPKKSAQSCGCDPGAQHLCERYPLCQNVVGSLYAPKPVEDMGERLRRNFDECADLEPEPAVEAPRRPGIFPDSAAGRKDYPVFTGFLMYFPDAIAEVARVSKAGNDQHNPGQPLHWAREKSTDQTDTAVRHMMDHGVGFTKDNDGGYHLAKAAWRILAELQLTIEKERAQ